MLLSIATERRDLWILPAVVLLGTFAVAVLTVRLAMRLFTPEQIRRQRTEMWGTVYDVMQARLRLAALVADAEQALRDAKKGDGTSLRALERDAAENGVPSPSLRGVLALRILRFLTGD